jgi:hypothetical protein
MGTHTDGPWLAVNLMDDKDERKAFMVEGPNGDDIASMESKDGDEAEANSLLMAAAPELLAALKHCVIERSEWLDEARAAIAKAEGRS